MATSGSLKVRLAELLGERSYRELAAQLGVSHALLWKAATGASIRPKSTRTIEDALERLADGEMEQRLRAIQGRLERDVGVKGASRTMMVVREAIAAAYEPRGRSKS